MANPYIQYISDFITINPTDSLISGNRVYNYSQLDKVKISGIEMSVPYNSNFFTFNDGELSLLDSSLTV